jgi:hypothetical protein
VRSLVERYGEKGADECDYCGGTSGPFVSPDMLGDAFRRVVDDNYVPVDQLSNARHIDALDVGEELGMCLDEDFGVFADAVLDQREQLLADILDTGDREDDQYPDGLWARKEQDWTHWSHSDYYAEFALAAVKFGHSLITPRGRVKGGHTVEGAVGVVRDSVRALKRILPKGTTTWRGRIGKNLAEKIGAPPAPVATAGRISKQGEPVLYLCLDEATPVSEVRPSIGDIVSVQQFVTVRKLKICDFTKGFDPCDPFVEGDDAYAKYQKISTRNQIRNEIGGRLARPVSRGDEAKEYLPTQLIASFAREAGFDGLMFSSTQRNGGENLVLFDPDDAVPDGPISEQEVEEVSYRRKERRVVRLVIGVEGKPEIEKAPLIERRPIVENDGPVVLDDIVV